MSEEFKVVIEGVQLPAEQRERIGKSIQRAVLAHLGELDLSGDEKGAFIIHGHTQGIWAVPRPLDSLQSLVPRSLLDERE